MTVPIGAMVAGIALPLGTLSGDAGRLLITFLGLISASILPTISLILSSMTSTGRSVKVINELQAELAAAMDALFFLFGLVGVSVVGLLTLAIPTPIFLARFPYVAEGLERFGQGLVATASVLIVMRAGQIPGVLRRSLEIRHRLAVDEARRKTLEHAPDPGAMREAFPTHPEFGRDIDLDEVKGREPH